MDSIVRSTKQVKLTDIQPHPENYNHGDAGAISLSLKHHSQYRAIVVSEATGNILAGNHTFLAAQMNGETRMLAHLIPNLTAEDELRIMVADNQYARLAYTDDAVLADLLKDLAASDDGLDATGWDGDDLDTLLAELERDNEPHTEPDTVIEVPTNPVTKPGDLWTLGRHKVICGDASNPDVWKRLCDGQKINVAVTSPPYAEQRDYDDKSGFKPIPPDDYVEWFQPIAANVAANLADDGSWFVNIKPSVASGGLDALLYVFDLVIAHVREWEWHFATEFCWERNGVPKSVTQRFKNQFEPVYQFTRNKWKMRPDNVRHYSDNALIAFGEGAGNTSWDGKGDQPGQGKGSVIAHKGSSSSRQCTGNGAVTHKKRKGGSRDFGPGLAYPGNRLPTFSGTHQALGHAAAYPIGLPQFFIEAFTDEHDITVDPFAGTGSSLIAAHNTNRVGYAIELSPAYCDVIIKRWETLTGQTANLMEGTTP